MERKKLIVLLIDIASLKGVSSVEFASCREVWLSPLEVRYMYLTKYLVNFYDEIQAELTLIL